MIRIPFFAGLASVVLLSLAFGRPPAVAQAKERHLLYVASPGIRNYVEYGGVGVLVFDMEDGHRWVKRIPTWSVPEGQTAENVKGVCASAKTGKLYVSTPKRILCIDVLTEKKVWETTPEGGCDRMALSPDGKLLYVPSFEGPTWNVLDALTGSVIARIETNSGAHNTVYGLDGEHVYLAGLKSPYLLRSGNRGAYGRAQDRSLQPRDPALHRQRPPDPLLRHRQRAAWIRSRGPEISKNAAPRRGDGLLERAGKAARLPQPRCRADSR